MLDFAVQQSVSGVCAGCVRVCGVCGVCVVCGGVCGGGGWVGGVWVCVCGVCVCVCVCIVQLCSTLRNPRDCSHQIPLSMEFTRQEYWSEQKKKNTAVGSHSLLQGIFPTPALNLHLLHCRRILCH